MALVVLPHIATGLALLGIASRRLWEAVRKLASQSLTGNELCQAAPRAEVRSWTALGIGYMCSGVSLHIATGMALLGVASRRLEEAVGTLASQGLTGNELWQAATRVEVRSSTALGIGYM